MNDTQFNGVQPHNEVRAMPLGMVRRFFNTYGGRLPSFLLEWTLQSLIAWIDGPLGLLLRRLLYTTFIHHTKGRFFIWPGVSLQHSYGLSIGRDTCINTGAVIDARGGLRIGDHVLIGPNVVIVSSTHDISSSPIISAAHILQPTIIGDDVWIGANAVIMGGVSLATGCVIGAGAIVTKPTDRFGVYVGNPARFIRYRSVGEGPTVV
jgi:maltose O-acetyltransferase